jgi:hypothetical protein
MLLVLRSMTLPSAPAALPAIGSPAAGAGVFVLTAESTLVPMQSAHFASEDDFQHLLARFPALLAGDQIDAEAPRRFLLVAREQGVASEEGGAGRGRSTISSSIRTASRRWSRSSARPTPGSAAR